MTATPTFVPFAIDGRRVISAAGIGCKGGPLGGEATDVTSYEVWTLHCPTDPKSAAQKLADALKTQVALQGATIEDAGSIESQNAGNDGDLQLELHGWTEDMDINIRVTSLKAPGGATVVVTIDQRLL